MSTTVQETPLAVRLDRKIKRLIGQDWKTAFGEDDGVTQDELTKWLQRRLNRWLAEQADAKKDVDLTDEQVRSIRRWAQSVSSGGGDATVAELLDSDDEPKAEGAAPVAAAPATSESPEETALTAAIKRARHDLAEDIARAKHAILEESRAIASGGAKAEDLKRLHETVSGQVAELKGLLIAIQGGLEDVQGRFRVLDGAAAATTKALIEDREQLLKLSTVIEAWSCPFDTVESVIDEAERTPARAPGAAKRLAGAATGRPQPPTRRRNKDL